MDDRVARAAENNARWCDLVCRSHRIPTAAAHDRWVALSRAPELYPDVVTLVPGLSTEDVLRSVEDGPGCSVKDSFADLDLSRLGFDELFQAHWLFRESSAPTGRHAFRWFVVDSEQGLREWAQASGLSDTIRTELFRDRSVRFFAMRGRDGLCAGAIANRTGSVVGVSNVFTTAVAAEDVWADIANAIAGVFPSLSLVGYERGEDLRAALRGGFIAIGALRVWRRPA